MKVYINNYMEANVNLDINMIIKADVNWNTNTVRLLVFLYKKDDPIWDHLRNNRNHFTDTYQNLLKWAKAFFYFATVQAP